MKKNKQRVIPTVPPKDREELNEGVNQRSYKTVVPIGKKYRWHNRVGWLLIILSLVAFGVIQFYI